MTVAPADWIELARGKRVTLCALLAGFEHPITSNPLTAVTWTSGADSAWHAGTSGLTSKPWLAVPSGGRNDPPPIVISERVSPVQGELEIGAVSLTLHDFNLSARSGELSVLIANRHSMPATALTQTLSETDTTAHVENVSGLGSSGTAYIGREVMSYSGVTGSTAGTLTGLTRALYGTRARRHVVVSSTIRPSVYVNPSGAVSLPSILGRRVTLWVLPMTGTTATDPQLIFDGRVGPGVSLMGAGWSIPLLHAIKSLDEKFRKVSVRISGIRHGSNAREASSVRAPSDIHEPLAVRWDDTNMTLNADDYGGWSESAARYIAHWSLLADSLVSSPKIISANLRSDGRLAVRGADSSNHTLTICADWNTPSTDYSPAPDDTSGDTTWVSNAVFPEAFTYLSGYIHFNDRDIAQIPPAPSLPAGAGTTGTRAYWTLRAKIAGADRVAKLASPSGNTVLAGPAYPYTDEQVRILTPTDASLGLWVESGTWWDALRYGLLPSIDGLVGHDHVDDSIDFDRVIQMARGATVLPTARRYDLDLSEGVLKLIRNEGSLAGLCFCTFRGRLAVMRVHEVSSTEPRAATITRDDLRAGENPSLSEAHDGLATSWLLKLADGRNVRIVDEAAEAEVGNGTEIEADGSALIAPTDLLGEGTVDRLSSQAMSVLAPISRPWKLVTLPLTLKHFGVQTGDVVVVSEWLLPDGYGARGLDGVPTLVLGWRKDLGAGTVDLDVLLSGPDLAGYAPEVLISAIAGATLTVDTTALGSDQGPHGFCDAHLPDDRPRLDGGASMFAPGDKVVLLELDNVTPATPETFEVVSVSSTTIVLDGSPSAAFTAIVGVGNFKVMLAYDDAGTATTDQRRYCYIANGSTLLIDGADPARRYGG